MSKELQFRISSALKDIIGRDLITDDYIAIFELVKNSYDAYATKVIVEFHNLLENQDAYILIKDNGKGMSYKDLIEKWLFVAYSAKRAGTEDENFNYRENIYSERPFAGAKGIGRFSCDRLGKILLLETVKKEPDAKVEVLETDWETFEKDLEEEFVNVSVVHTTRKKSQFNLKHGTALKITELRSDWDRTKLLRLKSSLAKLINPINGEQDKFEIILKVPDQEVKDQGESDPKNKVNGPVKNFIFEALDLKTTRITTYVSPDGKFLETELRDGNVLIYKIKRKNEFFKLWDVRFVLYYLNQSAKLTFARRMGLASRLFGNVFLYKNGIRIYPFGEPGEDPLNIDERKSRKRYSYIGTSELMGRIELFGDNPDLKETSSRGDGLIQTESYFQLKDAFFYTLELLEKYVIDVQEWGLSIDEELDEFDDTKLKSKVSRLIEELTGSKDILQFDYGPNFLEIISEAQDSSAINVVNNLKEIAKRSGDDQFIIDTKIAEKKLNALLLAKSEAEKNAESILDKLNEKESENLFLKALKSTEFEDIVNLMHFIGISASTMKNNLFVAYDLLREEPNTNAAEIRETLNSLNTEIDRIYSISRFATKANFRVNIRKTKVNLENLIREYLNNVVRPYLPSQTNLTVLSDESTFMMEVRPIEISILIDNLVNNAKKAKAKRMIVRLVRLSKNRMKMYFQDNGSGISSSNIDKVFNYGFTTTDGSGIGLAHVKNILKDINSTIEINREYQNGAEFIITFNRN